MPAGLRGGGCLWRVWFLRCRCGKQPATSFFAMRARSHGMSKRKGMFTRGIGAPSFWPSLDWGSLPAPPSSREIVRPSSGSGVPCLSSAFAFHSLTTSSTMPKDFDLRAQRQLSAYLPGCSTSLCAYQSERALAGGQNARSWARALGLLIDVALAQGDEHLVPSDPSDDAERENPQDAERDGKRREEAAVEIHISQNNMQTAPARVCVRG